jgi:16S rRNA (guanine966-N2)-methyltransferase
MLGYIEGTCVLDLYAGTGALGIESLSRGAQNATFVESSINAAKCLAANVASLGVVDRSRIIQMPVEGAWRELVNGAPYDIVFCDPPWSKIEVVWRLLAKLELGRLLCPGGLLVLEHPVSASVDETIWWQLDKIRNRAWGDSAVSILKKPESKVEP